MTTLNLTKNMVTKEQASEGVFDPCSVSKAWIIEKLEDMDERNYVRHAATLAEYADMIGTKSVLFHGNQSFNKEVIKAMNKFNITVVIDHSSCDCLLKQFSLPYIVIHNSSV